MAKERLSKIQKWMLIKSYEQRNEDFPKGFLARFQITREYFDSRTNSREVIVSRSIRSLIKKGYAEGFCTIEPGLLAMVYGMAKKPKEKVMELAKFKTREKLIMPFPGFGTMKVIALTEKGLNKAEELLMLSSDILLKLNNKESLKL